MEYDLKYMARCLQIASYGVGNVAPNPMVGAVLVHDGKIIGEGFHRKYGDPHAEPNAINSVENKELLSESTLYVSLEPCSHFGKTPPCANLIVASKIPRVIIGTLDPNPCVAGRGVKILRDAGIEVLVGVMDKECRGLNKRFFTFQEKKRPFVLLKWAQTQDGFIDSVRTDSSEKPLIISNPVTRMLTHKMRAENQSILVSTNTVLLDNPSLSVRHWTGKSPVRIMLDRQLRIPETYHLLDGNIHTIVFTEHEMPSKPTIEYVQIKFDEASLNAILRNIYKRNIHSVLVEGGSKLLNSFIQAGYWDEVNVEVSKQLIYQGVEAPCLNIQPIRRSTIEGHDWLLYKNSENFSL